MNLKKLKNLIANNQEGGSNYPNKGGVANARLGTPPPFYFIKYHEVMNVDGRRLGILRCFPTELLLEMIDNIGDLSEQGQKEALEEIIYILFEREVKNYEQETR